MLQYFLKKISQIIYYQNTLSTAFFLFLKINSNYVLAPLETGANDLSGEVFYQLNSTSLSHTLGASGLEILWNNIFKN